MGCQASIFEVRRCVFGDKLYGVTENYGGEGDDSFFLAGHSFVALFLENWALGPVRNIALTREIELLWAKLPRELYGWVDDEIFTQPSVVEADMLPELRREMRLTVDRAAEGDFVLEAAGPSDRLPFRAQEDKTH
ncbi:hypothetical protein PIB30_050510 [Stylosanthes scabra]|uniref:Uncharacterized protein n=1 Tax=Stylosanthes scabra TaxID=79078 RepID=A0ABU6SHK2_9FABA|nr:hypothetical protein [Stylosanthes scabra]